MSKLSKIRSQWPRDTVAACSWLESKGLYPKLIESYRHNQTLKTFGHGAVVRPEDTVEWPGALYTVQNQLGSEIHVGAKSALALKGYAHYLPMKKETLFLFGTPGEKLPAWFRQYPWPIKLHVVSTNLFPFNLGLTHFGERYFTIRISAPERAIMEVLYFMPQKQSYEEGYQLMEGLTTLRPALIQKLLEQCSSIKVKRLFMFLAEACRHRWIKRLNLKKINMGTGKRVIFREGSLDSKYQITVPDLEGVV